MSFDASAIAPEQPRRFSRQEFDRLVAQGWFQDERIELLDGVMIAMSPQGTLHAEIIRRLYRWFTLNLSPRAETQSQAPFAAADDSEPEPDVAVIPKGDYARSHPGHAFLIVEVSETSLAKDRRTKMRIYARANVPEYWIVNVVDRVVEVHTQPQGDTYASVTRSAWPERRALVFFPDVVVPLDELLETLPRL